MEQAKFAYSPLQKAFEKQIKTTKDQEQKQVEVLKTKAINDKSDNKPSISKEIYDKILEERMDEILEMSKQINDSNLAYNFKGQIPSISFGEFGGPIYTQGQLKNDDKTLQQVQGEQKKFKSELNEITRGSKKSENQKNLIESGKNLYNSRQKVIDLLNGNSRIKS